MPGMMTVVLEENGQMEDLSKLANFDAIASSHFEHAMGAAVAMGKSKVIAELRAAAESNRSAMISEFGADMQPLAPVNVKIPNFRITGLVATQGAMNIVGIVGDVNKQYLRLTENGRGPGKHPPSAALQDWAESVLGMTPAPSRVVKSGKNKGQVKRDVSAGRTISTAIARRGVKGTPVMVESGEAVEKHVIELFEAELNKVAAELGYKP